MFLKGRRLYAVVLGWRREGTSTVCDRFGKRAGQQGGENELNKVDGEELHKKKGGKVAEKWGERRGREAGRATT